MRLASVEVVPYALRFAQPYLTARGCLERREMALLRVRAGDGLEGLGEAVPLSLRGGEPLAAVVSELESWGRLALDRGRLPGNGKGAADPQASKLTPPAACAVETALLDLRARRGGIPAWRELGCPTTAPVVCNATLAAGPPKEVAERAIGWAESGFRTFKLKVGVADDERQVEAVRGAVGEDGALRVDANGVWSVEEALGKLEAMGRHGLELAEEPTHGLKGLAAVRAGTGVRVAADESISGRSEAAEAAGLGSCDLTTVKLSKVGGIAPLLEVASLIPTYLSSALDGPVGIAAAAHAAQTLRASNGDAGVAHGLATQRLFSETVASVECELRGAKLHLPPGPGLGVVIDEAALTRHRL